MSRYERHLETAAYYDRKGKLKEALAFLRKAERAGGDEHLPVWIARLEKQIEVAERQGDER